MYVIKWPRLRLATFSPPCVGPNAIKKKASQCKYPYNLLLLTEAKAI
jgi:hypothetical protein